MPTCDRLAFVPRAIAYFQRQDYPNKELLVIDDGADSISDLLPADERIRLIRLPRRASVGAKRNLACEQSSGTLIAHWDDDDWHGVHRLRYQVDHLLNSGAAICGLKDLLFLDIRTGKAWKYNYPAGQRPWLSGSSLVYTRAFWAARRFPEINVGEDSRFVSTAAPRQLIALSDPTFHVGIIHGKNVSPKQIGGALWKPYPVDDLQRLLGEDWNDFVLGAEDVISADDRTAASTATAVKTTGPTIAPVPTVRNVFACLVHESPECIVDLVCNLRHLDPASVVLIYNGSANPGLLESLPLSQHGAVVHPSPRQMAWGKLHDFALDCMRFGLEEFDFQTLTIVDSDQLAVRPGYSECLAAYLAARSDVGMLGNSPARQPPSTQIPPVKVAFAEIELWRPLLARFKDGEKKFAYWSFWPSTVYTATAARDLVRMFAEDEQLKEILARSRIWATEEVILPTLTALLGHEIAANPCNYGVVKYGCAYTNKQIEAALARPDIFWAHPIPRRYDDPLRKQVRVRHNQYSRPKPTPPRIAPLTPILNAQTLPLPELMFTRSILARMRTVEGWLEEAEANLLVAATARALAEAPEAQAVVEVGSYCGRATVVLAGVVKAVRSSAKVWSIDPHDGRIGSADRIFTVAPSLPKLMHNLAATGVADAVEVVQAQAHSVPWKDPIAFLLIDGLHDYASVASDFSHFEPWIADNGSVAFHDYGSHFQGVTAFVDELTASGKYGRTHVAGAMALLRKEPAPRPAQVEDQKAEGEVVESITSGLTPSINKSALAAIGTPGGNLVRRGRDSWICSQLTIEDARFRTRTGADAWAADRLRAWDESRRAVVLPMYGEFGWLIMTHVRFAHSLAAVEKIICCDRTETCLFPSATDYFCDWENPIDDNDRCGHSGYRHGDRCGPYDVGLIGRLSELYPSHVILRPTHYDCTWHLSDAVKFQPAVRRQLPPVDVVLGVRKRSFVGDKNWTHWDLLVRVLRRCGFTIGLVGAHASSFADLPADVRAWDHQDGDTAGSIDLLQHCRLYVGSDAGISHLAALVDAPMLVFRRELPGNPDWRGVMERSNKRFFRKLDGAAWFRPDEVVGSVLRCLTELGEDQRQLISATGPESAGA